MTNPSHIAHFRVYYEDTDAGGIVYHANYLKFAERARTDWLRELGIDQSKLLKEQGITCIVNHLEISFLFPAKLDDLLTVETTLTELKKVTLKMTQTITSDQNKIATLFVSLACINQQGKPIRIPEILTSNLTPFL